MDLTGSTLFIPAFWLFVNGSLVMTPQGNYAGPYSYDLDIAKAKAICEEVYIPQARARYPAGTRLECVPLPVAVPNPNYKAKQ